MKNIFCLVVLIASLCRSQAATIDFSGPASWAVAAGLCTFKVDGTIKNTTSGGNSGTLKIVLWASVGSFPSRGYRIAEYSLGQLQGGYQFSNFSVKTAAKIPNITGSFNFTMYIAEYTSSGWYTRDYISTGPKQLKDGKFVTAATWKIPNKPLVSPPSKVKAGDLLVLTLKATQGLNLIPNGSQVVTRVTVQTNGRTRVTSPYKSSQAVYQYSVASGRLNGKSGKVGRLYLDYAAAINSPYSSYSSITLYFQSPNTGVYSSTEVDPGGGGQVWGLFKFN